MAETPFLEARDVGVEFTTRSGASARALDGVHLSVQRGEILAIVGESGSGKTTLGRLAAGLVPLAGGEVLVEGENLFTSSGRRRRELRRDIAFVHQDPQAHQVVDVGELATAQDHLLVDRVVVLGPAGDGRLDLGLAQVLLDLGDHLGEELVA